MLQSLLPPRTAAHSFRKRIAPILVTTTLWLGLGVAMSLLAWVAFWQEPRSTTLTAIAVESPAWPADAAPVRIVFVSDIHVDGFHTTPQRVAQLAQTVNLLQPDLILLGGDYIGGGPHESARGLQSRERRSEAVNERDEQALRALEQMQAPLGVFAAMGNHDCWWSCERVRTLFAESGIRLLSNEAARIDRGRDEPIWIAGLADKQTEEPDIIGTVAQVPEGEAAIAIMHNPQLFDWEGNTFGIQFAGHNHGGQVRFPFVGALIRLSRHTEAAISGAMSEDGRVLLVSRGFGTSGLPVRFGTPPEIMLVQISHGPTARAHVLNPSP
jgi:predicted MPP superfamily phosphohydrolase